MSMEISSMNVNDVLNSLGDLTGSRRNEAIASLQTLVSERLSGEVDGETAQALQNLGNFLDWLQTLGPGKVNPPAPDTTVAQPDDGQRARLASFLAESGVNALGAQISSVLLALHEFARNSKTTHQLIRHKEFQAQIADLGNAATEIRNAAEARFKSSLVQAGMQMASAVVSGVGAGVTIQKMGSGITQVRDSLPAGKTIAKTEKQAAADLREAHAHFRKTDDRSKLDAALDVKIVSSERQAARANKPGFVDVMGNSALTSITQQQTSINAAFDSSGRSVDAAGRGAGSGLDREAAMSEERQKRAEAASTVHENDVALARDAVERAKELVDMIRTTLQAIDQSTADANRSIAQSAA